MVVPPTVDDFQKSAVLITGSTRKFGTGFSIWCEAGTTWILTCAHVVDDVGGNDKVQVDAKPAEVVGRGEPEAVDLAVLRVPKLEIPPFKLGLADGKGMACSIPGCTAFFGDNKKRETLEALLDNPVELTKGGGPWVRAWALRIVGTTALDGGYSGSPVMGRETETVFAVITYKEGDRGYAISLSHLRDIWDSMPLDLASQLDQKRCLAQRLWEFLEDLFQKLTLKKISLIFLMVFLTIIATSIIIWASKSTNYALYIKSEILPAKVYVDDRYVETLTDKSPDITINVSEGEHIVSIQSDGFNEKKPIRVTPTENPKIILFAGPPLPVHPSPDGPPPPPSRCVDNLLNCVTFGQMNVPGESSATVTPIPGDGLSLKFENNKSGTGVFFKFSSPVNLQNFDRLRIRGTSETEFEFLVEYKVIGSNEPIAISVSKTFPATTKQSVFIPIPLENMDEKGIDIIAINCLRIGDRSTFNIESIKLLKSSDPEW